MLPQSDPPAKFNFKNPFLYSWGVLVIAAFVVVWILFYRWRENCYIESRAKEEQAQKQREQDRATLEQMGGKELAIHNFYANPAQIRPAQSAQLCYPLAI